MNYTVWQTTGARMKSPSLNCPAAADVDCVMNLLSTVKNEGWDAAVAEDVLYGEHHGGHRHSTSYDSYEEPLLSLRQVLEDSKRCMAVINEVKDRLGKKIRSLRKRAMPLVFEDGIKRLPDELLAKIFVFEHFSVEPLDNYALRSVSHVCHRFREVALHTPRSWTRLAARNPDAQIQTFLSRSVGPYSNRWSHLELCDLAPSIMRKRGVNTFPRLRYLHHWDVDLFTCQMPSLSHIVLVAPSVRPETSFQTQLTDFEIIFQDEDEVDIDGLARALQCMRSLRDLNVHSLRSGHGDNDSGWKINLKPHSVQIDSLTVSVGEGVAPKVAQELYGVLSVFKASRLDTSLENVDEVPINYLINSEGKLLIFSTLMVFRINQELDIPRLIRTISESCDIAHTIYFDTPVAYHFCTHWPFNPKGWSPVTSICHLQFLNCVTLDENSVDVMAKHPVFAGIQKLEILHCSHVSEEYLLELQDEVGEKLKWTI
ncbi:hypothetical protein BD410DRAFT_899020 [Rickenella mellea]|uniref:F-box domain-containing protein n=1 Tax=Rickenella mellea TaxID=50990 RepID=A0A4Y7Q1S5_9AGAM|nr:hypothetical protein BD410DRAFT_899020 [Rickenella mellea]